MQVMGLKKMMHILYFLTNIRGNYTLSAENMGEDFKLKVDGVNEFSNIDISGYEYDTNLHITGYGSLIINKEKDSIFGLDIYWGTIEIDDTVNIDVDVIKKLDKDPDYVPSVIFVRGKKENAKDSIVLKNGDTPQFTTERYCYENQDFFSAIMLKDSVADYTGLIAEKNNRKYFVDKIEADDFYFVYYGDIKSLTYNGTKYYYLDESSIEYGDDKFGRISSTEDFENAGYRITDDNWDVKKATFTSFARAYDANEEIEYAIYSPDTSNESVNDVTDVKVTLDDGAEYTLVIQNNTIDPDSLHYKEVCSGWQHMVGTDSIRISAKRFQVVEGDNQNYIIGNEGISFKINADYSLFENGGKVYVDDKEITDYTSKEGSTIIILNKEYLSKLDKGNHTIRVTFNNGKYASANFQVEDKESSNPNTVDSVIRYVSLLVISTVGLTVAYIYKKKLWLV